MTKKRPIQLWLIGAGLVFASAAIAFIYSQFQEKASVAHGIPDVSGKWNIRLEMNNDSRKLVNGTMDLAQQGTNLDGEFIFQGEQIIHSVRGSLTPSQILLTVTFDPELKSPYGFSLVGQMNGLLAAKGTYTMKPWRSNSIFKPDNQKTYQWTAEKCSADEAFAKKAKSPGHGSPKYSDTGTGSIQDVIDEGPFYPQEVGPY